MRLQSKITSVTDITWKVHQCLATGSYELGMSGEKSNALLYFRFESFCPEIPTGSYCLTEEMNRLYLGGDKKFELHQNGKKVKFCRYNFDELQVEDEDIYDKLSESSLLSSQVVTVPPSFKYQNKAN